MPIFSLLKVEAPLEPNNIQEPIQVKTEKIQLIFDEMSNILNDEDTPATPESVDSEKLKKSSLLSSRWGKRSFSEPGGGEPCPEKMIYPKRSVVGLDQWGRK